jgi:hypothetical protein
MSADDSQSRVAKSPIKRKTAMTCDVFDDVLEGIVFPCVCSKESTGSI